MKIAIIGCGFVADYYLRCLELHPQLQLLGVTDKVPSQYQRVSAFYNVPTFDSVDELLANDDVRLVLNLTNPRDHYEVTRQCLLAGKHVYSEKPLSTELDQAEELLQIANERGLHLSSAPCSLLSESAQTIWKAIREDRVGKIRLVYAEMDDGLVHKLPYQHWISESGAPWPYKDEFEVGCTLEHAGYYLTWLPAFFGPATKVTAFADCLVDDKLENETLQPADAPDFSVACITFESGTVARLTCSIVAPHDHNLTLIGDDGILGMEDCWLYRDRVFLRRRMRIRRRVFMSPLKQTIALASDKDARLPKRNGAQQMDFCRGVAEMAEAINQQRSPRLSGQYSLHVNELVLAIHQASNDGCTYKMKTRFDSIAPMPWAE